MKMKRLFTLVLSLMMILSLSAPASAIDGENVYTKEEIRKKLVLSTRLMLQSMQRVLWKQLIAPQMLQQEMF